MLMKWTSSLLFSCMVATALVRADTDPLSGRWRLDTAKSTANAPMPKAETQTFEISGLEEHGTTEITGADGVVRKTEYTAGQNDGKWHPVTDTATSKPTGGSVMVVKVDDQTTWWFSKRPTGSPYMALRVVAKDGRTFVWTSIGTDGKVTGSYLFERE